MKNRITSAGAAADSEQKAEVPTSSPNNAKPNVIGSQSNPEFNVWHLLDKICDGLIGFKAQGKELYKVKTTLELPTESYNRFLDFSKFCFLHTEKTLCLQA